MTQNRIRMRHLRCFLAVAHHGSVTQAAQALGTVQPSVSRSIRELELELGNPVFERSAGGLRLNAAGQALFSYVSGGLLQVDRGIEAVRGKMAKARVTAYILPTVVRMIMPGAVRRFKALYPEIDLTFVPASGGGLQQCLSRGEVDFGFGRLLSADHMKGMNFEHLFSEPLTFFARADHPLAGQQDLSVRDLDRYQVLLPTPGTIIRDEIDRFLASQSFSRFANLIETLSFEFARDYVVTTDAVVCHPHGAMRRELAEERIVALNVTGTPMIGAVGITTPAARSPSASAQLLIQMIREEVAAQGMS